MSARAPSRRLEVLDDPAAVARRGADVLAERIGAAVAERGEAAIAVSGGRTPWAMFHELGSRDVPWSSVGIWQVDERIAPEGDEDRSLTHLLEVLPRPAVATLRPMPVEALDVRAAVEGYAASLPPAFDLVHLGLGGDGHTASLVPKDPVLDVSDVDVAVTGEYGGRRRMTLTFPVLDRAGFVLWVVTGPDKAEALRRLLRGDASIPGGRVRAERQLVIADREAAALAPG